MKQLIFTVVLLFGICLGNSQAQDSVAARNVETMIVYILSESKVISIYISGGNGFYEEREIKRTKRRDFNPIIVFLEEQYKKGWKMVGTNMTTGPTYEEFYYMLERQKPAEPTQAY